MLSYAQLSAIPHIYTLNDYNDSFLKSTHKNYYFCVREVRLNEKCI